MTIDINNKTRPTNVVGVISNWDTFTTDKLYNTTIPSADHDYTLNDLYEQLRNLLNTLNLEQLQRLEQLISMHVNNTKNPHKTSLSSMSTSVLKELYNLWIDNGYIGTEEAFLKQIFQYIKIADIETTLKGEALDEVPSVKSASELVNVHNAHPDAHDVMFGILFPGEEIKFKPSFAIHGYIGLPTYVKVTRSGPMWYVDKFGLLKQADINSLPEDYSFGEPCFPIFGANQNHYTNSEEFVDNYWEKINGTVSNSTTIANLKNQSDFAYFFKESQDTTPVEHVIKSTTGINVTQNKTYTISIYVYPIERDCFGIRVNPSVGGPYSLIQFELHNKKMFIPDTADKTVITGGIVELSSGWYRVWLTVKAIASDVLIPEFYPIDIYDGDSNYVGNGLSGVCLFGAQVSNGAQITPYIPSTGAQGTLQATTVILPTSSIPWYNPSEGTIICEVSNIPQLIPDATKEIYTLGAGNTQIAINAKFPTSHAQRCYFTFHGVGNGVLSTQWSKENYRDKAILIQSFNQSHALYGYLEAEPTEIVLPNKVNPNVTTLYLGCDRYLNNSMDGYLYRLEYYPHKCTSGNVHFFLGE